MKINSLIADRVIKREAKASKQINILTHYDHDTLLDKSGKLIKIIKLSGLDFFTQDEQTLDGYKTRRHHLLKSFSSEFGLYFWEVRRKVNQFTDGVFKDDFSKHVNDLYQDKIQKISMFHTEHYLAVMTKQPEGLINKTCSLLNMFNYFYDKKSKKDFLAKQHQTLNETATKIINAFADYGCELLSVHEKNGVLFSRSLHFLSQLINFDAASVPLHIEDVSRILPKKRLFFSRKPGTIEMRAADHTKKFAVILSIKAYTPLTYQGMLDHLATLRCEYVITQSYRFYDRQVAKGRLLDQQKEMRQSKEESESLTDEIDEAFDETASGDIGYGKHHFTLACYADGLDELNKQVGVIVAQLTDINITCVREDVACELGFWAQLPGNFSYIARACDISTKNMAAFVSNHNYPQGKRTGNHWGDAVTIFETLSGSPYYFNFHYKDVCNFLVFGAMGSGKTVLIGFLILQSMKFGGKRIIFDKDRGLEILVRAMGGVYEGIKPGRRTGFNPCRLQDTPENRHFLAALFRKMLTVNGEILSESDVEIIENAIIGLYRLDVSSKQLCHIASFFGVKKSGSLRARFDQWHSDGAYAWAFDNETDTLNLNSDVIGFDLGHILVDKECKTPVLMYLTYRVEQAIEGMRGILFIDEGWLALSDDFFKALIENWSRITRKKNNIFGLATQVANDTIHSSISKSINESAFCKIFFPNPSADRSVYMDHFGLSARDYSLVKTLPDDNHCFLLNHGRGTSKQSVVLRPNFTGLEDIIAIISAREHTLMLLDQIRAEVGNDPRIFLPIFHARRKEMLI